MSISATLLQQKFDCRHYVEEVFPAAARRSPLARAAGLSVVVALDVRGKNGGQWTLGWTNGDLGFVRRGLETADVLYRTDFATFEDVICQRRSPQGAFCDRLIEIEGDLEKALKLAVLLGAFLAEDARVCGEVDDAIPGCA